MTRPYRLSADGHRRLSQAARLTALRHRPWRFSTGPKTRQGKLRSARNSLFTCEHIQNPLMVDTPNLAAVMLLWSLVRYNRAWWFEDSDRRAKFMVDIYKWSVRLVELGDDNGLGRRWLDWIDEGLRGVPDRPDSQG